jgi:hypothetical protein
MEEKGEGRYRWDQATRGQQPWSLQRASMEEGEILVLVAYDQVAADLPSMAFRSSADHCHHVLLLHIPHLSPTSIQMPLLHGFYPRVNPSRNQSSLPNLLCRKDEEQGLFL